MAYVMISGTQIEYGTFLSFAYYVDGVRLMHTAGIKRAIQDRKVLTRRMLYTHNGLVEQYNHDKKAWKPVEVQHG